MRPSPLPILADSIYRLRCDGEENGGACTRCTRASFDCTFARPVARNLASRSSGSSPVEDFRPEQPRYRPKRNDEDEEEDEADYDGGFGSEEDWVPKQELNSYNRQLDSHHPNHYQAPPPQWRQPSPCLLAYAAHAVDQHYSAVTPYPTDPTFNLPYLPHAQPPAMFFDQYQHRPAPTLTHHFAPPPVAPVEAEWSAIVNPFEDSDADPSVFAGIELDSTTGDDLEPYACGTRSNVFRNSAAESLLSLAGTRG